MLGISIWLPTAYYPEKWQQLIFLTTQAAARSWTLSGQSNGIAQAGKRIIMTPDFWPPLMTKGGNWPN